MAKNQSTTKSETQSQGIFRQFFRAFKGRVSPIRPLATQSPISANPSTAATSNKVSIEYNHTNHAKRPVKFQGASNEKFSDFIDETKKKMKANSSFFADENGPKAGTKRATTRRDSFNDRISHFINRAKLKMRSTTIADGSNHTPR